MQRIHFRSEYSIRIDVANCALSISRRPFFRIQDCSFYLCCILVAQLTLALVWRWCGTRKSVLLYDSCRRSACEQVCEDFFVASLDIIITKLGLPPDVAGATFMAAGSSAPELFVAAAGVFITHDPVGVGACAGCAQQITKFVHGSSSFASASACVSCITVMFAPFPGGVSSNDVQYDVHHWRLRIDCWSSNAHSMASCHSRLWCLPLRLPFAHGKTCLARRDTPAC
eukprot:SAG31_NODE_16221_length_718_cov_0.667205_1_plen_227_part_00